MGDRGMCSGAAGSGKRVGGRRAGPAGVGRLRGEHLDRPGATSSRSPRGVTRSSSAWSATGEWSRRTRLIGGHYGIPGAAYDGSTTGLSADGRTLVLAEFTRCTTGPACSCSTRGPLRVRKRIALPDFLLRRRDLTRRPDALRAALSEDAGDVRRHGPRPPHRPAARRPDHGSARARREDERHPVDTDDEPGHGAGSTRSTAASTTSSTPWTRQGHGPLHRPPGRRSLGRAAGVDGSMLRVGTSPTSRPAHVRLGQGARPVATPHAAPRPPRQGRTARRPLGPGVPRARRTDRRGAARLQGREDRPAPFDISLRADGESMEQVDDPHEPVLHPK